MESGVQGLPGLKVVSLHFLVDRGTMGENLDLIYDADADKEERIKKKMELMFKFRD